MMIVKFLLFLGLLVFGCSAWATVGSNITNVVLSPTNSGAVNFNILNGALANAGLVHVACNGSSKSNPVFVNNTLTIYSSSNLQFDENCYIELANGVNNIFIKNANYGIGAHGGTYGDGTAYVALSSLAYSNDYLYTSGGLNGQTLPSTNWVTATCTTSCSMLQNGGWVYIAGADSAAVGANGPGVYGSIFAGLTAAAQGTNEAILTLANNNYTNTDDWNGIFQVVCTPTSGTNPACSGTTFTYQISNSYGTNTAVQLSSPATINWAYQQGGYPIIAMPADHDIRISGGTLDCNLTNNNNITGLPAYASGNDFKNGINLRRVAKLTITSQSTNNCRNTYTLNNIYGGYFADLYGYNATSVMQFTGSGANLTVDKIWINGTQDDGIAFLQSDYCQAGGAYHGDWMGWFKNIDIKTVHIDRGQNGFKFMGQTGFKFDNVHVGSLQGSADKGMIVNSDSSTVDMAGNSTLCTNNVPLGSVNSSYTSQTPSMQTTWTKSMTVDNLQMEQVIYGFGSGGVVESLHLGNVQLGLADIKGINSVGISLGGGFGKFSLDHAYIRNATGTNSSTNTNKSTYGIQINGASGYVQWSQNNGSVTNIGDYTAENLYQGMSINGSANNNYIHIGNLVTNGVYEAIYAGASSGWGDSIIIDHGAAFNNNGTDYWVKVDTSAKYGLSILSTIPFVAPSGYSGSLYDYGIRDKVVGGAGYWTCIDCSGAAVDVGAMTNDGSFGGFTAGVYATNRAMQASANVRGSLTNGHLASYDMNLNHWYQIDNTGKPVIDTSGYLQTGRVYQILTLGTNGSSFTTAGASSNTVGQVFTATGAGTASSTTTPSKQANSGQAMVVAKTGSLIAGQNYQILSVGSGGADFTGGGAPANTMGLIFTATGAGTAGTTPGVAVALGGAY